MYFPPTPTDDFLKAAKEKNYGQLFASFVFQNLQPIDVNARDGQGMPAFYYALHYKHFAMIRFLLERNVDVMAICIIDQRQLSLIEYAKQQGLVHLLPREKVRQYEEQKRSQMYVCGR